MTTPTLSALDRRSLAACRLSGCFPYLTQRQLRIGLIRLGIFPESITVSLQTIEDEVARAEALTEWEFASEIRREHPLVATLAAQLGISDDAVDELFIAWANL